MRSTQRLAVIPALLVVGALVVSAQTNPTTSLTVTPGSSTASQRITLTASVTPPGSTGKVAFFDGTSILGVVSMVAGQATFSTSALLPGTHKLLARVAGAGNPPSNAISYSVAPVASYNMTPGTGSPYTAGSEPIGVVAGDFNEDGFQDIAVANYFSNDVSVFLGSGDGTGGFRPAIRIPLSVQPFSLAAADFGNGHLDLAVATGANTVVILIGDGTGGFTQPSDPVQLPGNGIPNSIVAADFNADGEADIAVARDQTDDVVVLAGDGTGNFGPSPIGTYSVGTGRSFATVGDFNGDGFPDLAVLSIGISTTDTGTSNVMILLNEGDGSGKLKGLAPFSTGLRALVWGAITTADFNRDGNTDLAIAADGIAVFLGNGDGTFHPGTVTLSSTPDETPNAVAAADFNGDGFPDLAVGTVVAPGADILLGDGKGNLSSSQFIPLPQGDIYSVAVGDFNNDGRPDLALAAFNGAPNVPILFGSPLTIAAARSGIAAVGDAGTFQITVQNQSSSSVTGTVTVTDTFPDGLLLTAPPNGSGWDCSATSGQNVMCSRSDGLAPNTAYPPISANVKVTGAACQGSLLNVNDEAQVLLNTSVAGTYIESVATPLVQCFTVNVSYPPLVATQPATVTVTVAAAAGASIASSQNLQASINMAGLQPTCATGTGWTCTQDGSLETCTTLGSPGSGGQYPAIQIAGTVVPAACPTGVVEATVVAGGPLQTSLLQTVDLYGCLTVPPGLSLPAVPFVESAVPFAGFDVTSLDKHPIKVTASGFGELFVGGNGSGDCIGNTLNLGDTCNVNLFLNSCTMPASGNVTVTADAGVGPIATYTVPIQGSAQLNSLAINVNGGNTQIQAGQVYPVSMVLTPTLDPVNCPENMQPTLLVSVSAPSPDPKYPNYDAGWLNPVTGVVSSQSTPANMMLNVGTVAGVITLTAQVNNQTIAPLNGVSQITLQVPSTAPVIQSVSIANKSSSSFDMVVDAFSPPRETGSNAQTQVCLTFFAASGAGIQDQAPPCALQQEIMLWYNEAGSYQWGSQFEGNITVSYNGNQSAIGTIQVVVKNVVGPSAAYCVDFKSGNKTQCP